MNSYRFWNVSKQCIVWNGVGTPPEWRGPRNHRYDVEMRQLATPESRTRWVEHIAEKTWCSPEAAAEFAQIVEQLHQP